MPYDFIEREEIQRMIDQATVPLLREINELKRLQDEWVDTKTACRILGISDVTLAAIRDLDNPIKWKPEGRKPTYSRLSLAEYAETRTLGRHRFPRRPLHTT